MLHRKLPKIKKNFGSSINAKKSRTYSSSKDRFNKSEVIKANANKSFEFSKLLKLRVNTKKKNFRSKSDIHKCNLTPISEFSETNIKST